jgi:bifunctional non-homologous end joining protein LigD
VTDLNRPDRVVIDLDPPEGAFALVRRAAYMMRSALGEFGLACVPVATGSKGYHLVSAIQPLVEAELLAQTMQKFAGLVVAKHPDQLTTVFRIALRGERVFVDWMRAGPSATVVSPYSLRARPRATVATPLAWDEIDKTNPDAFTIADIDRLLDRPDSLAELAATPSDPRPFVAAVNATFESAGLILETFDRFRS